MSIGRMKAMKDFRGRPGEGTNPKFGDQFVEAGVEFEPQGEGRGEWLEKRGLAIPVGAPEPGPPKARAGIVQNEAAETGPLRSPGGGTGEASAASSSPAAPAPEAPAPSRLKAAPASSRSTKAGASSPAPMSSTAATGRGGKPRKGRRASKA